MAANLFQVEGSRVDSISEFRRMEKDGGYSNIHYYPDEIIGKNSHYLVFRDKAFKEVSFKDTLIKNVRFIGCTFETCLFMGAFFEECEFVDCNFYNTNTSKVRFVDCLIDPLSFEKNFDLVNDANIAVSLYHALYRNSSETHQPKYAIESLYNMKRAECNYLDYKKDQKVIGICEYRIERSKFILHDFISGYGLKLSRVARLLGIVIAVFTILNFALSGFIFTSDGVETIVDSLYFTCVTVTTLGYGDMTPDTQFGKLFVTIQASLGFLVLNQ